MRHDIARHGLSAFFRGRDSGLPDGRSLREYKLSAEEYESLLSYVRKQEEFVWKDRDCGALLLVLAEWTYREAQRLGTFWWDAYQALGAKFNDDPKVLYLSLIHI